MKITDATVLEKVLVLVAADTLVLAIWTSLGPNELRRTTPAMTSSGQLRYTQACSSPDGEIYFGVLLAMKAIVLAGALYLAWVLRNIKSVFSESKAIFFSVYNLAIWLVLVFSLVQLIGDGNPTVSFLLVAGGVWVNMTVTLISMFAPKLLAVVRCNSPLRCSMEWRECAHRHASYLRCAAQNKSEADLLAQGAGGNDSPPYTVDGGGSAPMSAMQKSAPSDKSKAILVKSHHNSHDTSKLHTGGARTPRGTVTYMLSPPPSRLLHFLCLLAADSRRFGLCIACSSPPSGLGLTLNTNAVAPAPAPAGSSPGHGSARGQRSPSNFALAPPTVNQLFSVGAGGAGGGSSSSAASTVTGSNRPPSPVASSPPPVHAVSPSAPANTKVEA